jgi:HEAT repeat protein
MTWNNRRAVYRTFTIAVLTCALGCAGNGGQQGPKALKVPPRAPDAPAVPAVQHVEVDPQLQVSARQELQQAFQSNDPVLRANAIEAAQNSLDTAAARQLILGGLADSQDVVRFAAAMAAGKLRLREAYKPLLALVNDRDVRVRVGVRYALHRLGDTRFSHDLERTAQDPSKYIRADTAMVLGMLNEPSALKILRQMQNDDESIVRLQVAEAMWRLGDEQGLESLTAASISKFADDQIIATQALSAPRDRRVLEHLRGKLTSDWAEIGLVAARAMGELGSDEGYGVAITGARSADPRQKSLAALAFGAIGRPDAQTYLAPLLHDPSAGVRLATATGLLQLGKPTYSRSE